MESGNTVYTKQQRIAELARIHPDVSFTSLAHHIDLAWLYEAFGRTRKDGAPGIDQQTAEEYEKELNANLRSLLERAKSGKYVAPPVLRAHIPKDPAKNETRPIGIPTFEDKVLQRAWRWCWSLYMNRNFWTAHMGSGRGVRPTTRCNRCGRR